MSPELLEKETPKLEDIILDPRIWFPDIDYDGEDAYRAYIKERFALARSMAEEAVSNWPTDISSAEEFANDGCVSDLAYGKVENCNELFEMLRNPLTVRGFDNNEAQLSNEDVAHFVTSVFGDRLLSERPIYIVKDNHISIKIDTSDSQQMCILKKAAADGRVIKTFGVFYTDNIDDYRAIVAKLDDCPIEDIDSVRHNLTGFYSGFISLGKNQNGEWQLGSKIGIHSFKAKSNKCLDELTDTNGLSDLQKQRLSYYATIAHEIAHYLEANQIPKEIFEAYKSVYDNNNPVTDYVRRHIELYGTNVNSKEVIGEDFAESMKRYLIDSKRMKREFPARYTFFTEHFADIQPDHIMDIVKNTTLN